MTASDCFRPTRVARAGGAERGARDQPLEVLDGLERLAELAAVGRPERELLDGVEPIADGLERDERPQQPGAQQPAAHRRDGAIELVEQRSVAAAFRAFDDLEMLERRRIDQQRVGALAVADRADVREVDLLRAAQIVDERAGGRDRARDGARGRSPRGRRRAADRAAPGAPLRRRTSSASTGVTGTPAPATASAGGRRGRRSAGTMISRGLSTASSSASACSPSAPWYSAAVNSPVERSSSADANDASACRAGSSAVGADRHQERRLARVEVAGVGQRARRDDADDFALDEALGLARILDLIADGDAEALLHEPRDVAVDGVKRHAAHRDAAAVGVLRARGERQLERARRDEGVFVEHLVEVAHAEEQDRVAMLLLRVEILPHRRRRRR